jgi:porin
LAPDAASAAAPCPPAEAPPAPDPFAGDLFTRQKLTGDWGGFRSQLLEKGMIFDTSLTQFYQGVTHGGRERTFQYGGKLDYIFNLADSQKAGLWPGFFVNFHAETRYGEDVNAIDGSLAPANLAMMFPASGETITSITALKFTQALSENLAVFFGKFNTLDDYRLGFAGGRGLDAFQNGALALPFNTIRTIPYSTLGAGFAILKDKEPVFSFLVLDAVDHPTTSGLNEIADRGVVLVPELRIPYKLNGLPGHQIFSATWSSRRYTSLDRSSYAFIPGEGLEAIPQSGSWSVNWSFDQYLWVDACNPKRGWGVFWASGLADKSTSPIEWFISGGVGGNNLLCGREDDTFGLGLFYLGISSDFKDLLDGRVLGNALSQRDEYGLEIFYNMAITPWCRWTADFQVVQPSTKAFDTSIVLGTRLKIDF